ncbi:hypothetical protein [Buttiauxella sp. BIGb0552]|uniref:hypothetical protein n=1 Tax=Buttiauxella sp. BIGb0552 TaxID=2485120 RepID=UPI001416F9EA|nr:hypothetical protein [Buttiauxella sp. BIGb0552]
MTLPNLPNITPALPGTLPNRYPTTTQNLTQRYPAYLQAQKSPHVGGLVIG